MVDYIPNAKYDLIVSISTLEHVGFDDDKKEPFKILDAISNLKDNCLAKWGKMIVTLPLGYNPNVDSLLFDGKLGFTEMFFMKRINRRNDWEEARLEEVKGTQFNSPYVAGNAIVIGIIENK